MGTIAGVTDPDVAELLQEVADRFRERGERMTTQRRAVLRALAATPGHLSAEEIQAVADEGALHLSSIYRSLEALASVGVVQHIHLGHGATAYHLAREGAHLHLECRVCGAIRDLPVATLDGVAATLRADHAFVLEPAHTALSGRCADCADHETDR